RTGGQIAGGIVHPGPRFGRLWFRETFRFTCCVKREVAANKLFEFRLTVTDSEIGMNRVMLVHLLHQSSDLAGFEMDNRRIFYRRRIDEYVQTGTDHKQCEKQHPV